MNKILIFLVLLILPLLGYSQRPTKGNGQNRNREVFEIKGIVLEKTSGLPLEFATIILKPLKGQRVFGGLTDQKGKYIIEVPKGRYTISYEFISFKTLTINNFEINSNMSLKTVQLEEDAETLQEVELIAEKSTMEIKLDKKVYNVVKDMTVKGGTASDVLDNVPSVTVDADGVVSLRGNVDIMHPHLVPFNDGIAIPQVGSSSPQRLHLRAGKNNTCFNGRLNSIVVKGFLVGTDDFLGHSFLYANH